MIGRGDLRWSKQNGGLALHLGRRTTALLHVVPDQTWPSMWRIKFNDGSLSDMVNLTRAKDAACDIAIASHNREIRYRQSRQEPVRIAPGDQPATPMPPPQPRTLPGLTIPSSLTA